MTTLPTVPITPVGRLLTAVDFQRPADVPPEAEWFANLGNKATRRAYEHALKDFMTFIGIAQAGEFRGVTRAHVIAWRDELARRALSSMTIRHRLAALSSLFEYLCERNAVTHNPVKGVKRPAIETTGGRTPAIADHQARKLLDAPDGTTINAKRDRAILATLLYHALRRDELCRLKIPDYQHERRGIAHLRVFGKGGKTRYLPLHPAAGGLIAEYLEADGRGGDDRGPLFRPIHHSRVGGAAKGITPDGVYKQSRRSVIGRCRSAVIRACCWPGCRPKPSAPKNPRSCSVIPLSPTTTTYGGILNNPTRPPCGARR